MPTAQRIIDDHAELSNILGDGSYHLSSAQRTAAIRDATNSQNGLMPTGKLTGWDAAYSHIHNLTTDIDHDTLTNSGGNAHIDWTAASENLLTTGSLHAESIRADAGNNPTWPVSDNVVAEIGRKYDADHGDAWAYAQWSRLEVNYAAGANKVFVGNTGTVRVIGSGSIHATGGVIYGQYSGAYNAGTGIVSNAVAVIGAISNSGAGSITSGYAFKSAIAESAGTITNAYHYYIADATGTPTTQYGLYLEDLDAGGTNYGIYFAGTSGLARQGLNWNGDTNLYRSAANVLKTDDGFQAASLTDGTATLTSGILSASSVVTGKINPTAAADVNFFDDALSIDNGADGKAVYFHRKAQEGNSNIKLYIDQYGYPGINATGLSGKAFRFYSTHDVEFYPAYGCKSIFGSMGRDSHFGASGMGSGKNPVVKHYGYITAQSAAKYIQWKVDDTNDTFTLTRQDVGITEFDCQMPFRCDSLRIDASLAGAASSPDDYFVISLNGTDVRVPCQIVP